MTKIPWTEETWNPVVGCTKIALGCKHCYAEKFSWRLACMGKSYYNTVCDKDGWNGTVLGGEDTLEKPLHWLRPRKIFVCSMSDLFHPKVPDKFIGDVFDVIRKTPQHTYQILTKRTERMAEFANKILGAEVHGAKYLNHVWWGTSISIQAEADKNIPILLQIPNVLRFLSIEPMLEEIDLERYLIGENGKPLKNIHWLIIGCESGPKARLCTLRDIRWMVEQGKYSKTPVFVKQVPINGKCNKKTDDWDEDLRVQEYPENV